MQVQTIKAADLMEDDHLFLSGNLARVARVKTNDYDQIVVTFQKNENGRTPIKMLILSKSTKIEIFNQ